MPECNVDGCTDRAVAKLVGADGYERAYRCRDCLEADLASRDGGDSKFRPRDELEADYRERFEAHLRCTNCESKVTVAQRSGNVVYVCHCTQDGEIEPMRVHSFDNYPDRWTFVTGVAEPMGANNA